MLHTCPRVLKLLSHYNIVGLVHTGTDGEDTVLDGYTCITALVRPVDAAHGGLALFARNQLAERVRVMRSHPELGQLWVRVEHPTLAATYICICYMPPHGSSYYGRSGRDKDTHWTTLSADAAEFGACGPLLLLGDFNARTKLDSDLDAQSWREWEGVERFGGVIPPPGAAPPALGLAARRSMDTKILNQPGRRLLQMCRELGLVILNGRLPGDEEGQFTFHGSKGQSLIDYAIASPALAFTPGGKALRGARMHVVPNTQRLPARPGLGNDRFDHVPVGVRYRLGAAAPSRPKRMPGDQEAESATKWKWRPDLWEEWNGAVGTAQVQEVWDSITSEMPADEAVGLFRQGLELAVEAVQLYMPGRTSTLTAPALAVLVKFEVFNVLVGTPFDKLPAWIASWQRVDPTLLSVIDLNKDGILQLGEMRIGGDIIVLATPEIGGLPYVVSGMVAAGGLMATAQLGPIAKDFKIGDVPVNIMGLVLPALTFALASVALVPMIGVFQHDNLLMVAYPGFSFLQMLTVQYLSGSIALAFSGFGSGLASALAAVFFMSRRRREDS